MRRPGEPIPSPERSDGSTSPVPVSKARLWLFRLALVLLVPLLVFGGLEAILRLTGFGYPTSFFLPARIHDQPCFVPNPEFTCRFFSATQARATLPIKLTAEKSANTYRLFVFGESAAVGDPDSSFGVSRYLQTLLRERYPKTDFEVICVAITGINSHTILPMARECARHQGDLWLIYMGNNEMVGPFGAETVFGARAPSLALARATLAIKTTRTGQLLNTLVERLKPGSTSANSQDDMQLGIRKSLSASPAHKLWGGMQMFTGNRLLPDDPARLRVYENFKGNLDDILDAGRRAGVPVILSTVAVNLKESPPFASLHRAGWDERQETSWKSTYDEGVALENAGSFRDALARYREAAKLDPEYADLQFRMGRCELALTNNDQARRDFELARDDDALAFRTDSKLNDLIRSAAARHASQGVRLLDSAEILAQASPGGIPGLNFFYEHVHLNFEGNYLLAVNFAEQVRKLLPDSITARDQGGWATAELCDRRLAATVWDRQRVWQPIFNRITAPPFTGQLDHETFLKLCGEKLNAAKTRMSLQTPEQVRQVYEAALAAAPDDDLLHGNYELFLEAGGYVPQAAAEARRVCELDPFLPAPFYRAGILLVRLGKVQEAEESFHRAIAIKNDYPQACNELGLIYLGQQQTGKAIAAFHQALKADPDFADAYVNLGFLEQRRGRMEAALEDYGKAARIQPQGPPDYFERAVRLAAAGRLAEASGCFQTLVQQVPSFWQARYLLGEALAAAGNHDEAQAQFSAVLHYRPDYAALLPGRPGASRGP